jgi:hypothetical protein
MSGTVTYRGAGLSGGVGSGINLDAWGHQKVVHDYSLVHGMFTFEVPSAVWKESRNGIEDITGFTNATSVDGKLNLVAGATLGDLTVLDTFRHPRYEPNRGHTYSASVFLPDPTADGVRDFGMFTGESGVFFRLKSDGNLYACRTTTTSGAGTVTFDDEPITIPFPIDLEKGNIYDIQMQWRGVGNIKFFIGNPATGLLEEVYSMDLLGNLEQLSVYNPAMPIAFRCENLGDNVAIESGCVDVSTEGGSNYDGTYGSLGTSTDSGSIAVSGIDTPVLVVHSKSSFSGRINTRDILNLTAIGYADQRCVFRIWLTRDGTAITLNDQAWTDFRDANIEYIEYNTPIVATPVSFDKTKAIQQFSARVNLDDSYTSDAVFDKAAALVLTPGDYLIFTMQRENAGNANVGVTYEFSEEI